MIINDASEVPMSEGSAVVDSRRTGVGGSINSISSDINSISAAAPPISGCSSKAESVVLSSTGSKAISSSTSFFTSFLRIFLTSS